MTNEEKVALFEKEIAYIESENIKDFFKVAITLVPDYFFEVPASSSGKFHSVLECGFGGLVCHTRAVSKIANYLVNLQQYKSKLNEVERDCVICAALLHDCVKHDWENKTGFSVHQHPMLAAEFIKTDERLDWIVGDEVREMIGDAVASHSGEWATSNRSKVILPSPQTLVQELVHLSDFIASRGDIHILFEGEDNKPKLPDVNTYVFPLKKHAGELLVDVFKNDRPYIEWVKETVHKEPLISLIKLLEEQERERDEI